MPTPDLLQIEFGTLADLVHLHATQAPETDHQVRKSSIDWRWYHSLLQYVERPTAGLHREQGRQQRVDQQGGGRD